MIAAMVLAAVACKVEKTDNGTYKVESTTAANDAAAKAKNNAKKAGDELKSETKELGEKIKAGAEQVKASDAAKKIKAGAKEAAQGIKQGAGELVPSRVERPCACPPDRVPSDTCSPAPAVCLQKY